jgi:hypothetical protein
MGQLRARFEIREREREREREEEEEEEEEDKKKGKYIITPSVGVRFEVSLFNFQH